MLCSEYAVSALVRTSEMQILAVDGYNGGAISDQAQHVSV